MTEVEQQQTVVENLVEAAPRILVNGKEALYPGAITVYNVNGQTVAGGKDAVSLQHLSRGIYIIQGRSGRNVQTIKVAIGS